MERSEQWPILDEPAEPRLPLAELADMPAEVLETVRDIESKIGRCPSVVRTLALATGCLSSLHALLNDINTRQSLSMRRREILVLYISRSRNGRYEWIQHEPLARRAGLGDPEIHALRGLDITADCFPPDEQALLGYVHEVTTLGKATRQTFDTLREHLSPQEIVELTIDLGFYRMLSELTENAETPLDPPFASTLLDRVMEEQRTSRKKARDDR